MQKYDQVKENRKDIIINNFLGGISWGLGASIGLAIVIAILGIILKQIDVIPIIGNFVTQITNFVIKNSHIK